MSRLLRRLTRDRAGAAALEFALVAAPLLLTVFIITGGGLLLWAKSSLQLAAAQTARCVAIRSTACADRTAYANSVLGYWGASTILGTVTVTVDPGSACGGTVGTFAKVTVAGLPGTAVTTILPLLLQTTTLTAISCYPSGS